MAVIVDGQQHTCSKTYATEVAEQQRTNARCNVTCLVNISVLRLHHANTRHWASDIKSFLERVYGGGEAFVQYGGRNNQLEQ